ncbi:MAG: hypothetical protein JSU74_13010 [Candidatus Zixiibacteriota bacterium]|nr:MAG: hypothetical protein JSU74_13010 [candidate division Zixibacteria bacterium]
MISRLLGSFLVFTVLLADAACAGEKLVYAVRHKSYDQAIIKTEVFSIDPETGERELILTDEISPSATSEPLLIYSFPVLAGGEFFACATERDRYARPIRSTAAFYEISIDDTCAFRQIAPVSRTAPFESVWMNSDGTLTCSVKWLDQKQYILIHSTSDGRLVRQIDASDVFMDCYASSVGWLPDSDTLFFSLETGDVHVTSEESYEKVGTYLMDVNNEEVIRLAALPTSEGYYPPENVRMIGVLPTGEYVFAMMERKKDVPMEFNKLLLKVDGLGTDGVHTEDISFGEEAKLPVSRAVKYLISPSGRFIAVINGLTSVADTSKEIWIKDMPTGDEKVLFSLPIDGLKGPLMGFVGWLESQ